MRLDVSWTPAPSGCNSSLPHLTLSQMSFLGPQDPFSLDVFLDHTVLGKPSTLLHEKSPQGWKFVKSWPRLL